MSSSDTSSLPAVGVPPLKPVLPIPRPHKTDPSAFWDDPPPRWFFMDDGHGGNIRVLIPSCGRENFTRKRIVHPEDCKEYGYWLLDFVKRNAYGEADPNPSTPSETRPVFSDDYDTKGRRSEDDSSPQDSPSAEGAGAGSCFGFPCAGRVLDTPKLCSEEKSASPRIFQDQHRLTSSPPVPAHKRPVVVTDVSLAELQWNHTGVRHLKPKWESASEVTRAPDEGPSRGPPVEPEDPDCRVPPDHPWYRHDFPYQTPKSPKRKTTSNINEGPSTRFWSPPGCEDSVVTPKDQATETSKKRCWQSSINSEVKESPFTVFNKYEFEEWYPRYDKACKHPRGMMFIKRPGNETIVMDEKAVGRREFRSLTAEEAEIVDVVDAINGYDVPAVVGRTYRIIPVEDYSLFRPEEPKRQRLNDGTWQPAGAIGIAWSIAKRIFKGLFDRIKR